MQYKFKVGSHYSKPRLGLRNLISFRDKSFKVRFKFDSGYESENSDQWNKLCGISWSLKPNKNAIMIGYRFNPISKKMEITPYSNIGFKFFTGDIMECEIGKEYMVEGKVYSSEGLHRLKVELFTTEPLVRDLESDVDIKQYFWVNENLIKTPPSIPAPKPQIFGTYRQPYHGGRGLPLTDYQVKMEYIK
jgi:hypothetical protein